MIRIDSHAHLNNERFNEDRGDCIASLSKDGVVAVLECATEPKDIGEVIALAETYPIIYAAVGIHPHDADGYNETQEEIIRAYLNHPKVVAVGEIGLDYHYDFTPREVQKDVLRRQLQLAVETGMPVSLHSRESTADMMEILREFPGLKGVMHCFSGSVETMWELMKMGLYIGFGGSLTFNGNQKTVAVAKEVPADRYLLETDSPYLTPVPFRGKRNDPGYTRIVAEKLAQIRNENADAVAGKAMENTLRLFPKMKIGE